MKKQSFYDILKQKMEPVKTTAPFYNSALEDILENISPLFKISVNPKKSVKAYPQSQTLKKPNAAEVVVATPATPKIVFKKDLSDDEIAKCNLFELTFAKTFGESITRTQVMTTFRAFVKRHHPDIDKSGTITNFAQLVKIKDELLEIIDIKLRSLHTESTL